MVMVGVPGRDKAAGMGSPPRPLEQRLAASGLADQAAAALAGARLAGQGNRETV